MANRYRLTPTPGQEAALREHCAHARFVWNLAVEQQSWWRPGRGSAPGAAVRMRQLAEARAAEPWLRAGSSSVQQQALRDFDKAMAGVLRPAEPGREAVVPVQARDAGVRDPRREGPPTEPPSR
jgi:putative transposase